MPSALGPWFKRSHPSIRKGHQNQIPGFCSSSKSYLHQRGQMSGGTIPHRRMSDRWMRLIPWWRTSPLFSALFVLDNGDIFESNNQEEDWGLDDVEWWVNVFPPLHQWINCSTVFYQNKNTEIYCSKGKWMSPGVNKRLPPDSDNHLLEMLTAFWSQSK